MPIKCTMLIQQATAASSPGAPVKRIAGWSESWYWPGTSLQSAITAMTGAKARGGIVLIPGLALLRAALLNLGGSIVGIRFQGVNPIGPSQTLAVNYPGKGETDFPSASLLTYIPGQGVKNIRRHALRGLEDAQVFEGEYSPSSAYTTLMQTYFAGLVGFQFQGRDLSQPLQPIDNIDGTGKVTTIANHPYQPGEWVRILKSKDSSGNLRGGRFNIPMASTVTNSTFTISRWPYSSTTGGNARLDPGPQYFNADWSNATTGRVVYKKVGRPFVAFHGRRSRRR